MIKAIVTVEFPLSVESQAKIVAAKAEFDAAQEKLPLEERRVFGVNDFYNRGDLGSVHREQDTRFGEGRSKLANAMKGWKLHKEDILGTYSFSNGYNLQYQQVFTK